MNRLARANIRAKLNGTPLAVPDLPSNSKSAIEELERRWLRLAMDDVERGRCIDDIRNGRVYSFSGIARMLNCSAREIRRLFRSEPGVLHFKRDYRVPDTVLRRVLIRQSH